MTDPKGAAPRGGQSTVRAHLERRSTTVRPCRVIAIDGPDRGKELVVSATSPAPLLVGTGPACDLVLIDPQVSRRHLSLSATALGVQVVDLGSTNGTQVGSIRIADAVLTGGEVIRLGASSLRVDLAEGVATASLWPTESFGRLLGASVAMRRLYPLCAKLAASSIPLIVEGATGTGKELLAESLHEMGPRKNHPFVVFDCAAIDSRNVEVALFGEEQRRGGSNGEPRKGVFEEAGSGTLLIDEITELPLVVQAKLLRVLERGEICRVGGDGWVPAPARVIATSRRNVDHEVELGRFREDLFFRLGTARIELPPLRQRQDDLSLLADHFWRQLAEGRPPPPNLTAAFEGYAWPGNVRELFNVVARKVALGDVDAEPRAAPVAAALDSKSFERVLDLDLSFSEARARVVSEFERFFVERVLAKHDGNVSRAAAASGIARRYFQILRTRSR